jgi:hypothetical protein
MTDAEIAAQRARDAIAAAIFHALAEAVPVLEIRADLGDLQIGDTISLTVNGGTVSYRVIDRNRDLVILQLIGA